MASATPSGVSGTQEETLNEIYYFEDLQPGDCFESGFNRVTEEDIVKFARQYDPHPFHTGDPPLIPSMFDGLIAAGWHTGAICIRQMADALLLRCAVYCSPGVGDVRWHAPMRPDDEVRTRVEVKEKTISRPNSGHGRIRFEARLSNARGELLLSMHPTVLFARRNAPKDSA